MEIRTVIVGITAVLSMGVQAAKVLEYDANDLALTADASGVSWSPAVNASASDMSVTLGGGSSVIYSGSAYFANAVSTPNSGVFTSFKNAGLGTNATSDFSFEIWVKPSDLSGSHILFETGGATVGTSILLIDNTIHFIYSTGGSAAGDVTSVLTSMPTNFIQIVGVIDVDTGMDLYVSGALANSTSLATANWGGANGGQFGGTDGNVANAGGGFISDLTAYDGDLALARFYDTALTSNEVVSFHTDIAPIPSPPPAEPVDLVLEYDAADLALTGDASTVVWSPSTNASAENMDVTLGAGSSVVTPLSAYFNRSVDAPNSAEFTSFMGGFASGATTDFSFEMWVKPASLSGEKILFETGGATIGTSLLLDGGTVHFVYSSGGSPVADVTGSLASMPSDFIQIVGVVDVDTGLTLYLNGSAVNSASTTVGNWAGASLSQFGGTAENVAKPAGFVPVVYDGDVALARFYENALSGSQVSDLYDAVVPEIDFPTGLSAVPGNGTISLDWDDNNQSIFDFFTVYRSTTSQSGYSVIESNLTASSYDDGAVVNGTTYYYVITATDTNGISSAYSTEVAVAPFSPSVEDGLIVHLDASLAGTVQVDGSGDVISWLDLTGNGNDPVPTAGDLPVTFPSGNLSDKGLAGVDSDSSGGNGSLARMDLFPLAAQDSWLDFTGSASGNSGFSVLASVQCDTFLGGSVRDVVMGNHGDASASGNFILRCEYRTVKAILDGNEFQSTGSLLAGATVVIALNYDAATGEVVLWDSYSDNSVTGSVAATDFSGAGVLRLFGTPNADQGMDGMIGEVKIYSKVLDSAKFISEREAMKAKWADDYVAAPSSPSWLHPADLLTWSPSTDPDSAFYVSRVPLQDRFWVPQALKANSNARSGQGGIQSLDLFSGSPEGNPVMGAVGSTHYTFAYWQYLDEAVYWGGVAGRGLIIPPSPEMIDNAHRNGVPILGTIFFPPTVYGGDYTWVQDFIQDDSLGGYPVADKLIEVAQHMGFDGWFINQETAGGNAADAAAMRDVIKYIRDNSDIRISWYDAMSESGSVGWQNRLNTSNDWYMRYPETSSGDLISDSMFVNFQFWNAGIQDSRSLAISLGLDPYKLYAGVNVQGGDFKTDSSFKTSYLFPDGADHVVSMGLFRPNSHARSVEDQDLFWSGSSGDPRDTATPVGTGNWYGIAHNVAARSPINSLPFATDFCLGSGTGYFIDGEQVWNKNWWNRSLQSVLPTWRWIIDSSGTALVPEISLADAYQGGAHLKVSGTLDAENVLRLYLMDLAVSADTELKIVYKVGDGSTSGADAQMDVGVSMAGSPTTFTYYDVGGYSTGWNEAIVDLSAHDGQNIAALNLRFTTGTLTSYEMRVGMISIYDSSALAPAMPQNVVEQDMAVRSGVIDGRVVWDHVSGDVYYYNVYIRNADDTLSYVGSTANNYYYFGNIPYTGDFSSIVVEAVDSGFVRSLVSDQALPALRANVTGGNFQLSWPQGSGLSIVESRDNLVFGDWSEVSGVTIVGSNGTNYVELPIGADPQLFYRLKK